MAHLTTTYAHSQQVRSLHLQQFLRPTSWYYCREGKVKYHGFFWRDGKPLHITAVEGDSIEVVQQLV